jgi:hypothetical protein
MHTGERAAVARWRGQDGQPAEQPPRAHAQERGRVEPETTVAHRDGLRRDRVVARASARATKRPRRLRESRPMRAVRQLRPLVVASYVLVEVGDRSAIPDAEVGGAVFSRFDGLSADGQRTRSCCSWGSWRTRCLAVLRSTAVPSRRRAPPIVPRSWVSASDRGLDHRWDTKARGERSNRPETTTQTNALCSWFPAVSHAPGRIRTCDRRIRSPVLCPLSYGGFRRRHCRGGIPEAAIW